MNAKKTEKNKLLSLLDNLIEYRKVFIDYDRYRSKNQEKINAIVFSNQLIEPCQIKAADKTLSPGRTSFYKKFQHLQYIRKKLKQSNDIELQTVLMKTISQLELSRYYLKKCIFNLYSNCRTKPLSKGFNLKKSINVVNYQRTIRRISNLINNNIRKRKGKD